MKNSELMQMSLQELSDLNKRIIEVSKLKRQNLAFENKEQLAVRMIAEYVGTSNKIHYKEFEIIKINRIKAECKCVVTGKIWTIQICNLKATDKKAELSHSVVDRTERKPNNKIQW